MIADEIILIKCTNNTGQQKYVSCGLLRNEGWFCQLGACVPTTITGNDVAIPRVILCLGILNKLKSIRGFEKAVVVISHAPLHTRHLRGRCSRLGSNQVHLFSNSLA